MGVQPDGEPTEATHSYCSGTMSWISGCSSKPNEMPSTEEPSGSFEINQDPSGSIRLSWILRDQFRIIVMSFYVVCLMLD